MFSKLKKPDNKGFTIIEVMIVLAIAALILLIVLLAVPALQRNSRNTAIKNDASSLAGAINTYESDNNGTVPNSLDGTGNITLGTASAACGASPTNTETARLQGSTAVHCVASDPTSATLNTGELYVWVGHTCTINGGSNQASTRAFAIYYVTENSGDNANQCLDS